MAGLIGQLYEKESEQSLTEAIQQAVIAFLRNPHLSGLVPQACHVPPHEAHFLPDRVEVVLSGEKRAELPVVADPSTCRGHILICCPDEEVCYAV